MKKIEFFDYISLENRLINNNLILGKYTTRLFLIAYHGEPIKLDIDLTWENISTINVFAEIGKFCDKIGSCTKVEIVPKGASIRLIVPKESNSEDSITDLARAIDKIRFILETCLVSKCPLGKSDGLDNPDSQKSKDLASIVSHEQAKNLAMKDLRSIQPGSKFISDRKWNERKAVRNLPAVDPSRTIDYEAWG